MLHHRTTSCAICLSNRKMLQQVMLVGWTFRRMLTPVLMKLNGSPRLRLHNEKSDVWWFCLYCWRNASRRLQTPTRCDARQHWRPSPASGDVDETWVRSRLWPSSSWSAFQSIRTNNDVEGWHKRLNQQAPKGKLNVCQLVALLFCKSDFVSLQCLLVSERRVRRHQRKRYVRVQGCRDTFWLSYSAGEMMMSAQYVYGPAAGTWSLNSVIAWLLGLELY